MRGVTMHTGILPQLIEELDRLVTALLAAKTASEKIKLLLNQPRTVSFLKTVRSFHLFLQQTSIETQVSILSVLAIGEGEVVFRGWERGQNLTENLEQIGMQLKPVESFYDKLGGIVGYHLTLLKLLEQKNIPVSKREKYEKPPGVDLSRDSLERRKAIRWGIDHLPELAEIYPIGGAGDRLNLIDPETGDPLPAATLKFCGKTLIELLIRDLFAREYLYKKLYGKRLITPIVLMTSYEKDNDRRVRQIFIDNNWFGRSEESYYFIIQPLVPVVTVEGHWVMKEDFQIHLKPGGHGAIWKLAWDQGAFEWLHQRGRKKALIRQINNPIAGTDYGLLAFSGWGCHKNKQFGFASCPRVLQAAEGMDVLVEAQVGSTYQYRISNIEYTDFSQRGVKDEPMCEGSPYSHFPANTNILFTNLETIQEVVAQHPFPGMLVNFKNTVSFITPEGLQREVNGGRLELTMQNLSDVIIFSSSHPLEREQLTQLPVYLTYNERRKTISTVKRTFDPALSLLETPEGCFYDIQQNYRELLEQCGIKMPQDRDLPSFVLKGPSVLVLLHPAIGPLHDIIRQKIRGGKIGRGSELQVEMAEIEVEDLELQGSLIIQGEIEKSRLTLRHVRVDNQGIDWSAPNLFWKNEIVRRESLNITLQGSAEFFAEDVTFVGRQDIVVPSGFRWIALQKGEEVIFLKEAIQKESWSWHYSFDQENGIVLERS